MEETPLQALIEKYQSRHWEFAALDLSDINQTISDGDALIHLVAFIGGAEELDLLVSSGANMNAHGDLGYTPLHLVALRGHIKIAEKLLALGANPNALNEFGETPLKVALNGEHAGMVKLLKRYRYSK